MAGEDDAAHWRARWEAAVTRAEALEQALVRLAGRLALAAHGIDPRLDRELEQIRDALRGRLDPERLDRHTEALAAVLRRLAEAEVEGRREPTPAAAGDREPPREEEGARTGESGRDGRRGFLARLFGGRAADGAPAAPAGEGTGRLAEALTALVEALPQDPDLAERAARLRERAAGAEDPAACAEVLEEAARLVAEGRRRLERERSELESFLTQLGERLQEIDGYVQREDAEREAARERGLALDEAVRGHFEGIERSVRQASDLDSLKAAVRERLEQVRSHLAEFREAEEARYRAAREEAEKLRSRLETLERETESLRERVREERRQALRDPLTGLPNRLAYEERIAQEHARWRRFGTPLSLVVLDVDRFKAINDRYGHRAGDKVLRALGRLLGERLRETDLAARYGGEEFVLVLPGADAQAALQVAEEIRRAVAGFGFHHAGEPVEVTVSCGVTSFREGDEPERVFERADAALYRAKAAGRNRSELG